MKICYMLYAIRFFYETNAIQSFRNNYILILHNYSITIYHVDEISKSFIIVKRGLGYVKCLGT